MAVILRVSLFLLGVLYIFVGYSFLTDPVAMGADFGIAKVDSAGAQGFSTIRADFTSFFWVTAGCLIIGVWKANASLLNTGAALMGLVFLIRGYSLLVDGNYEGWMMPMAVELLTAVLALAAARALPNSD
ncbi:hypothetical protein [uncultured Erythrobacter sp.]|uniref:hypothetical protein n=1 Tax=uncultured Erythrobacter sp. TaxID=263913 RepID=UPI00261F778B|nr:hypothetical protein [uncultured Erythrobacter sp.]